MLDFVSADRGKSVHFIIAGNVIFWESQKKVKEWGSFSFVSAMPWKIRFAPLFYWSDI